ncbi:MAG: NAD(P)-dependent oxidoreductase [Bacteroidetes bacterium]|jgi:UDP-glucose 4-epimerase|nr:NAD(P)-dependent oxidoreductase [Bacteroidota bacterium]
MLAKRIVVTGSSGFLGTAIIKLLTSKGHTVVPVSRKLGFDICKPETLKTVEPFDVMIHLAAHTFVPDSYNRTAEFFTININGTLNALELCKTHQAKMIFASSYVYGQPSYLPVDEQHPVNMWNPYASSKIISEQLCHVYHREFDVPIDVLRIFNIYGPGQNQSFLIPKIIKGVFDGQINLETLIPKRDFVHVNDVAQAFLNCAENNSIPTYTTYNVGSGVSYSVQQIIDKTEHIAGRKVQITCSEKRRANEVLDVVADYSKIKHEKHWHPHISIDQGLKEMIEVYKEKNKI